MRSRLLVRGVRSHIKPPSPFLLPGVSLGDVKSKCDRACWCGECDRPQSFLTLRSWRANLDAALFADGLLFESCYRSPGHQLL